MTKFFGFNFEFLVKLVFIVSIFTLGTLDGVFAQTISTEKSLLVRDPSVLNQINREFDFAHRVSEVSPWLNTLSRNRDRNGNVTRTTKAGEYFAGLFSRAANEQINHDVAPSRQRLGERGFASRRMDRIFSEWKSERSLQAITDPKALKGSPFRLLAVVNLLDHAGDIDDRGLPPTTMHPRSLGEMHLVYGYISPGFERSKGKAYPQTFVISYRLPILRTNNSAVGFEPNNNRSMTDLLDGGRSWKNQMQNWADLWISLSQYNIDSDSYVKQLRRILRLIVRPENFLNVRANTKITNNTFELREWYIVNNDLLIPRKPRREPYRCAARSMEFGSDWLDRNWNSSDGDLDMSTYTLDRNGQIVRREGKNGYTVTRTIAGITNKKYLDECGGPRVENKPFEMDGTGARFNGGEDRLVAPFARVTKDFVWNVSHKWEGRRHAFAIRTCSGCHTAETGTNGFHIFPRLQNQKAGISKFMRGGAVFKKNGRTYKYNELAKRKKWLQNAQKRNIRIFDNFVRDDRTN